MGHFSRRSYAAGDNDITVRTTNFRPSYISRLRHFSPEPSLSLVPVTHHADYRRYSTAGNLDLYRPKSQRTPFIYDTTVATSPIIYWRSPVYDSTVSKTLASDNGSKVRYHSNGPQTTSYLPLTSYAYNTYPYNLTSLEKQYYPRATSVAPLSSVGRRTHDTQYDVDQFDNLLKRTFGSGAGSRTYTSPYSSYYSPYYSYPYSRYSSYYNERPYYSDSYSYPYYYTSPYYSSYYNPSTYYGKDYYGHRDLGYYGSAYYPSRYTYGYTV